MKRTWCLVLTLAWGLAIPGWGATGDPDGWKNPLPEQAEHLLIRGATVWTSGPEGRLEGADVLISKGVIQAIGQDLTAPVGARVVEAEGLHLTPGLIDAHSHSALIGGTNEGTNIVTAEVRIGDVINSESVQIYRQLAGGVTTINLLHGSANAIGGQNAVIKLRWGAGPDQLLFEEAPQGVKLALGENPKQSNWGVDEQRFPQTRQGVEQAIRQSFLAAQDYRRRWQEYEIAMASQGAGKGRRRGTAQPSTLVPPKRDLQLEAVVEMLDGSRLIHSHSYRADEILMLMRLAEAFGIRVASFQHVLEGYKVADELAAHGAGASTFSDWWAYKYEVVDAIPYNGAIMRDRGVVVSFNSDSSELARRLNLEAAKAVRYGEVPQEEALKFVTLNPAKQLGIDRWVGSLEVGKHADLALWSGHPLSTYSRCEKTWVDGRLYFDRQADLVSRQTLAEERQALMEEVRSLAESKAADEKSKKGSEEGSDEGEGPESEDSDGPTPQPSYLLWQDSHDEYCWSAGDGDGVHSHAGSGQGRGEQRR